MNRGPRARGVQIPLLERPRLVELSRSQRAPFREVVRAKMIVLLAQGLRPTEVGRRLGCSTRNVRKWRSRWEQAPVIESLRDQARSGRPRRIGPEVRCHVIQLACERPDKLYAPFRDVWTQESLATALRLRTKFEISRSSVQRILSSEGIRPHRNQMWLHSPDPEFRPKVARICDIYLNPPDDAVVLCIDEKPMQALERRFATTRDMDGTVRRDFEYHRRGVSQLLGAFNTRTGELFGQVVKRRTGDALLDFMDAVAKRYLLNASFWSYAPPSSSRTDITKTPSLRSLNSAASPRRDHPVSTRSVSSSFVVDTSPTCTASGCTRLLRRTLVRSPISTTSESARSSTSVLTVVARGR